MKLDITMSYPFPKKFVISVIVVELKKTFVCIMVGHINLYPTHVLTWKYFICNIQINIYIDHSLFK